MYRFVDSLNKLSSLLGDGNIGTDDMWPLAIRKKELNIAEWALAHDARDLMGYQSGTIDSSGVITLPTDWIETHVLTIGGVVVTNDREIALEDIERYASYGNSIPYFYFWTDAVGELNINLIGAVEGSLYKLYYFKKPTSELSDDNDISLHQEEFRPSTAYHAASELMRQIGNMQKANEYRAIYEAGVIKADNWARKKYITKNYARPDFGGIEFSQDTQGQSYL